MATPTSRPLPAIEMDAFDEEDLGDGCQAKGPGDQEEIDQDDLLYAGEGCADDPHLGSTLFPTSQHELLQAVVQSVGHVDIASLIYRQAHWDAKLPGGHAQAPPLA
jgi:hypothetical protein